jgi:hypothetical protein
MMSRKRASVFTRLFTAVASASLIAAPVVAGETLTYGYDALGRLIKVSRSGTVNNNASECYAYDAASNRSNVTTSIASDCNAPSFSINDASATEGGYVTFTVTRDGPTTGSYTVNYATANNTAAAGSDYTATSGTLTFGSGVTTQTIQVPTFADALVEGNETFYVNLSAPSGGAGLSDGQGVGTIIDGSSACTGVSFTIASNGAVTEGANSVFTVTKAGTATGSCNVNYATTGGTATSGSDFSATSGTLTFTSAQTSQTVSVPTIDDATVESAESFSLALSSPTGGAALGTPSSATATINDNDGVQPPVANDDFANTTACGSVTTNVIANDTDPGGNTPLKVTGIVSSTKGNATIIGTTSIEFDAIVASGSGSVTYTVTNTKGASSNGTLWVTISGGVCP